MTHPLSDKITEALCRAHGHRWKSATEARRDVLRKHYEVTVHAIISVLPDEKPPAVDLEAEGKNLFGHTPLPEHPDDDSFTDTLPAWLCQRYGGDRVWWEGFSDEGKDYWVHEASAVRRAVARNGFRTPHSSERSRAEALMTSLAYTLLQQRMDRSGSGVPDSARKTLARLIDENSERLK